LSNARRENLKKLYQHLIFGILLLWKFSLMTLGMLFNHNNLLEGMHPFDMSCTDLAMYEHPLFS